MYHVLEQLYEIDRIGNFKRRMRYKSKWEKMLNITHYQRNANQNHYEVPFHASQNGCDPKGYKQ